MQLQIKPGLRRIWRAGGSVQIGLSQQRGTVLGGLLPDDVSLLEQLREGVDAAALQAAAETEAEADRRRELVRLLTEAGVLVGTGIGAVRERLGSKAERLTPDATVWSIVHQQAGDGWGLLAARMTRRVVIVGAGRLGSTLAATLTAAGVGEVFVSDHRRVSAADLIPGGASNFDLGRTREEAALEAVRRLGGRSAQVGTSPAEWTATRPDLVVLIEHAAADATVSGQLVSSDVPHLSVVIREDDVVVGPLVRPGHGPCLRCLDLHRGDRDPAWPSILTQLLGSPFPGVQPEETVISTLAASLAGLQVLAQLDGVAEPASIGATLEIELPDGLIARRSWPAHPRCGCHRLPDPESTGPDQAARPASARPRAAARSGGGSPNSGAREDRRNTMSTADARGGRLAGRMGL